MLENKKFDYWNPIKKGLDLRTNTPAFFKEREVWNCSIGHNVGSEINGKYTKKGDTFRRPVLILKTFKQIETPEFGRFIGIPLTSKDPLYIKTKNLDKYYFDLGERQDKKGYHSYIVLQQIRLFNSRRLENKVKKIGEREFQMIKDKFKKLTDI